MLHCLIIDYKISEMKQYVATIINMPENSTREVNINDRDVYLAHKSVLMGQCSSHEEVLKMHNVKGDEVFDLKRGFHGS